MYLHIQMVQDQFISVLSFAMEMRVAFSLVRTEAALHIIAPHTHVMWVWYAKVPLIAGTHILRNFKKISTLYQWRSAVGGPSRIERV